MPARTPRFLLGKETLLFLVMGGINTFVTWLLYLALLRVVSELVAYSLSYAAGIVLAYFLNTRWVFETKVSFSTFMKFPLVYVVQYGTGLALMYVLVDVLSFPASIAPLAVTVLTLPITFLMSRSILRERPTTD